MPRIRGTRQTAGRVRAQVRERLDIARVSSMIAHSRVRVADELCAGRYRTLEVVRYGHGGIRLLKILQCGQDAREEDVERRRALAGVCDSVGVGKLLSMRASASEFEARRAVRDDHVAASGNLDHFLQHERKARVVDHLHDQFLKRGCHCARCQILWRRLGARRGRIRASRSHGPGEYQELWNAPTEHKWRVWTAHSHLEA